MALTVPPLKIGSLTLDSPVILAPMAGYTDAAMRPLCREHGCGLVMTEVISAEGINRHSRRTLQMLEAEPGERPIAAHLYGARPEALAAAAAHVEALGRFDTLDINCGCPVRKIVAKGAGAALMGDPARIEAIVRAVRAAVKLPVTVKTRIGLQGDRINISEVAHAVEAGGAAAIAIHARVAANRHAGAADWGLLARVKAERAIPVIGNGGIACAADAVRMFAETGVDGVMVGRAAVGNPWIFEEIRALLGGPPAVPHTWEDHRRVMAEHIGRMVDKKDREWRNRKLGDRAAERAAVARFRGHLHRYLAGFEGWPKVRRALNLIRTVDDVLAAVDSIIAAERAAGHALPRGDRRGEVMLTEEVGAE